MNKYLILTVLVGALILTGLGAHLINRYGRAKYDAGYNKAQSDHIITINDANNNAIKELEGIRHETRSMVDSDIDTSLDSLGIMRPIADR